MLRFLAAGLALSIATAVMPHAATAQDKAPSTAEARAAH